MKLLGAPCFILGVTANSLQTLDLPLGGGLLNGVLQPLTGALADLEIPLPRPGGLKKIPDEDHEFRYPGPTDRRGTCPMINAMANHGYIDRTGITSFAEVVNAMQEAFNLGYDVSVVLSAFALFAGGDLLSGKYSIGGYDDRVPNTLGLAPGMSSHVVFEIDGSITRQDTHWGNNANLIYERWLDYANLANTKYNGSFGFDMQAEHASIQYDLSRKYNPSFLAGFLWLAVSHVERVFVSALTPNGTKPSVIDESNIAPFFLNETFPSNWYRRATPWNAPENFGEAFLMYGKYPKELGANVGLNNFVPLGMNITGQTPEDITCFVVMNLLDITPAQLQQPSIANHTDLWKAFFNGIVKPFFVNDGHFNCPTAEFLGPSQSAGEDHGSYSTSESPIDGAYPGLGYIQADGPS